MRGREEMGKEKGKEMRQGRKRKKGGRNRKEMRGREEMGKEEGKEMRQGRKRTEWW